MAERDIELKFRKWVERCGGKAYKFVSPGHRFVPDSLVLFPVPKKLRAELAKYIYFVELKAPGEIPAPGQLREHNRLRRLGFKVEIIDRDISSPAVPETNIEPYL